MLARTRSCLREDRHLAKTASPINVTIGGVNKDRKEGNTGFRLTRDTSIEGSDGSPFTSALLSGGVEDLVNHGFAIVVLELEDVGGDVNQEGVEDALVPLEEDIRDLVVGEIETVPEDVIGLSNQLHVTIFNAWAILVRVSLRSARA